MKVTLTFNLPDEAEDLRNAQHGTQYICALEAIDNRLRNILKYESDRLSEETRAELQSFREFVISEKNEAEGIS